VLSDLLAGVGQRLSLEAGMRLTLSRALEVRLLVVTEGVVAVMGERRPGWRRIVKRFAGPESVLLPPAPDESIEALRTASLSALSARAVSQITDDPAVAGLLVTGLEVSLRDSLDTLGAFSHVRHADRVYDLLVQLARTHGRIDAGEGVRIDVPLTHALVAEAVGSARETASRAIEALQRSGLVMRDGGVYRLLVSPESLFAL
jgi:CRP-like cAMP-binding protein